MGATFLRSPARPSRLPLSELIAGINRKKNHVFFVYESPYYLPQKARLECRALCYFNDLLLDFVYSNGTK